MKWLRMSNKKEKKLVNWKNHVTHHLKVGQCPEGVFKILFLTVNFFTVSKNYLRYSWVSNYERTDCNQNLSNAF